MSEEIMERVIAERAADDAHWATAWALLRIAKAIEESDTSCLDDIATHLAQISDQFADIVGGVGYEHNRKEAVRIINVGD